MEGEAGPKFFIIMVVLLTIITAITRQLFFIFLDVGLVILLIFMLKKEKGGLSGIRLGRGKQLLNIEIGNGYYKIGKSVKTVMIVDDIPYDYRDLSDESLRIKIVAFNKFLDTLGEVQYLVKKQPIDKNEFLKKLFDKARNLRVVIGTDPSNHKAKNELQMVQAMINKINQGEMPFRVIIYFLVKTDSVESVKSTITLLKKGLETVGLKGRPATKNEITDLLEDDIRAHGKKPVFPTTVPYISVFALPKAPRYQFFEDGVYIGKEIGTNRAVFWNYSKMLNQHTLLIGPTGAGKTEAIISLAYKLNLFSGIPVIFFDTKSDIKLRLKKYNIQPKVINPLIYGLGLLKPDGINLDSYITQLVNILENSFQLDKYASSVLYKALKNAYQRYDEPTWGDVSEEIENMDLQTQIKTLLIRLISQINEYDHDKKYTIIDLIQEGYIYVIDLSLTKSEEVKRLIMLSTLTKIYNKYNVADDKLKIALVVDEAWTVLKDTDQYSIIADIIKRGRGYGIMLLMATQNVMDLGQYVDIYLQNIGLIAFMNNGDKKFWQEVLRFVNINDDEIKQQLTFLGRGEALLRFITDPRPVIVSLDTFVEK